MYGMGTKELDASGRVATSIKIKPEVWKKAKIEAIKEDIELSTLVEKAINAWVRDNK